MGGKSPKTSTQHRRNADNTIKKTFAYFNKAIIFQAKKTKDTSNVQFIAVLSVAQLEYLLTNVATMYINVENGKRTSSEREYIDFYHELQKNVKNYLPKFRPY